MEHTYLTANRTGCQGVSGHAAGMTSSGEYFSKKVYMGMPFLSVMNPEHLEAFPGSWKHGYQHGQSIRNSLLMNMADALTEYAGKKYFRQLYEADRSVITVMMDLNLAYGGHMSCRWHLENTTETASEPLAAQTDEPPGKRQFPGEQP